MQGCFCPNLKVPKGLEILFQDLNCLFELRRKSSIFFIARRYIFPGAQISTIAGSCLVDTCNPEPGDGMHCTALWLLIIASRLHYLLALNQES